METNIVIDPEFKALIPPHSEEEREGLERDLLRDGCRDPLVVWRQANGDRVLLEGHTRHEICERHGLPYRTIVLDLPSRADAMIWICENQLNRRNLNEGQRAMVGAQLATMRQGARTDLSPIGAMSQQMAAKATNGSTRGIQRGTVILQHGSPKLIAAAMRGIVPPSVGEVITKLAPEDQDRIAEQCLKCGHAKPARQAAAKVRWQAEKQSKRTETATPVMDGRQLFAVVLADPWRPEPERLGGRDITIQRCLVAPEKIKKVGRDLAKDLQPDAALFLRVPGPRIPDALILMEAWGFEYCAQLVCPNQGAGLDEYVRYDHELLLIGTRGDDLVLNPADRPTSVINGEVCQIIEKMYPGSRKLALFPRTELPGWTLWHYETGAAAELGSVAQESDPIATGEMLILRSISISWGGAASDQCKTQILCWNSAREVMQAQGTAPELVLTANRALDRNSDDECTPD